MGNILSYASSPLGAPATDDRWLKVSASELMDIESLTKEYAKLPPFEGTEAPIAPKSRQNKSNGISPSLEELASVFCVPNLFALSDDESRPYGNYTGVDIMIKSFIDSSRRLDLTSGFVRGGPSAVQIHALLQELVAADPQIIAKKFQFRIRARALLRLHLAITRQNNVKASLVPTKTPPLNQVENNAAKSMSELPASDNADSTTTSIPVSLFDSLDKSEEKVVMLDTETDTIGQILFSTSISISLATVDGLCGTPYYFQVSDRILRSIVESLVPSVRGLLPLPRIRTLVTRNRNNSQNENGNRQKPQHPFSNCQVLFPWDRSLSNSQLAFSDGDDSASRPGSISSYPAALCKPELPQCTFTVVLTEARNTNNWLTIGISLKGFPNSSSDGFGRQSGSWGLQDDRSNSNDINIYDNSNKVGTFRKLEVGDIISLVVDFSEGWCELRINFEEFKYRFVLPSGNTSPANYCIGATFANDHKLQLLPWSYFDLQEFNGEPTIPSKSSRKVLCSSGHVMESFARTIPPTYVARHRGSSGVVVNCDKCSRKSIQTDRACFYHCSSCSYDLCFACSLPVAKKVSESAVGLVGLPRKQSTVSPETSSQSRSPFANLRWDSPALDAINKILVLAREHFTIQGPSSVVPANSSLLGPAVSSFRCRVEKLNLIRRTALGLPDPTEKVPRLVQVSETPQDVAVTSLFAVAVMQESLGSILEVVDLLTSSSGASSPCILRSAEDFVVRLIGAQQEQFSNTESGTSPDSTQSTADSVYHEQVLGSFFDASVRILDGHQSSSAAPKFDNLTSLFGSINWVKDPALNRSDRQAIAILDAVANIVVTEKSGAFIIASDVYLEILLVIAERGALALCKLAELHISDQLVEFNALENDSTFRRDVYLGSAALNIVYCNLMRIMKLTDSSDRAKLLDTLSIEDSLQQSFQSILVSRGRGVDLQSSPSISYRDRIKRLIELIYSNVLVDPNVCEFGETAVMFAELRDLLTPRASQQFSTICGLLEKSDSGFDTFCERALVIKMMDGMEGPKLLELLTPSTPSNSIGSKEDEEGVERFVKSILILADRNIAGKIKRVSQPLIEFLKQNGIPFLPSSPGRNFAGKGQDSTISTSENLTEGMLRVLEPITVQTFSTIANRILISTNSDERIQLTARIVDMVTNLMQSAISVIASFNVHFSDIETISEFDKSVLSTTFSSLSSEIAKSHIASLVPVALFATSMLWTEMNKQNLNQIDFFTRLFKPLCVLSASVDRAEKICSFVSHLEGKVSNAAESNSFTSIPPNVIPLLATPVLEWDVSLSNSNLQYTENNRACMRPGSTSCYPAAFAIVPAERSSFSVTLASADSNSNWLSIGLCCKGFATSSSDGIGRSQKSWGISDDRSKSSENSFFAVNGTRLQSAPRKLKVNDVITMQLDLGAGRFEISVNAGEFKFEFSRESLASAGMPVPQGAHSDYWFGATFANDHRLVITPVESVIGPSAVDVQPCEVNKVSWVDRLSQETRVLQHYCLEHLLEFQARTDNQLDKPKDALTPSNKEISRPLVDDASSSSPALSLFDSDGEFTSSNEEETESDSDADSMHSSDGEHNWRLEEPTSTEDAEASSTAPSNLVTSQSPPEELNMSNRIDHSNKIIDPAVLEEISNWLDSSLFANGIFNSGKIEPRPSFTDLIQDTSVSMPNNSLILQWTLLRQLTDAPNGMGESQRLVNIMKRFVREDQGSEAGPNHAVHATCAALIWHEGLGAEAVDIVRTSIEGRDREIRPSAAFQHVWKLGQSLRQIYPDNHDLNVPNPNSQLPVALESDAIGELGNVVDDPGSEVDAVAPPIKLMKQFSLPIQEHGQGPLRPETLAAVRRARLLLSYEPAITDKVHGRGDMHGQHRQRARSDLSNPFYDKLKSELCVALECEQHSSDHHDYARLKCSDILMSVCVLNFIQYGPDPDSLRKVVEDRKVQAKKRCEGLNAALQLLRSTHSIRFKGELLQQLAVSMKNLSEKPLSGDGKVGNQLHLDNQMPESKHVSKHYRKVESKTFKLEGYHFAMKLRGIHSDEKHELLQKWIELIDEVSKFGAECVVELNNLNGKYVVADHSMQLVISESIQSAELTLLRAISVVFLDYHVLDLDCIAESNIVSFLGELLDCSSDLIRKSALYCAEHLVHLCIGALQFAVKFGVEAPAVLVPPDKRQIAENLLSELLQLLSSKLNSMSSSQHRVTESEDNLPSSMGMAPIFQGTYACDPFEEGLAIHAHRILPSSDPTPLDYADHSFSLWVWIPDNCSSGLLVTRLLGSVQKWSIFSLRLFEDRLILLVGDKETIGCAADNIGAGNLASDYFCCVNMKTFEGVRLSSTDPLVKREWLHIGCTIDARGGIIFLSVNGVIVGHTVVPPAMTTSPFPFPEIFDGDNCGREAATNSQPFYLGQPPATFATIGNASTAILANIFIAPRPITLREYAAIAVATLPHSSSIKETVKKTGRSPSNSLTFSNGANGICCSNRGDSVEKAYIPVQCSSSVCVVTLQVGQDMFSSGNHFAVDLVMMPGTRLRMNYSNHDLYGLTNQFLGEHEQICVTRFCQGRFSKPVGSTSEEPAIPLNNCAIETQELRPLGAGDIIKAQVNFSEKKLNFQITRINPQPADILIIDMDISRSINSAPDANYANLAFAFAVTLAPGQQVILQNSIGTELTSPSIAQESTTASGMERDELERASESALSSQSTNQVVDAWDPNFSDRQRLELTSFNTIVYFPGHASSVASSCSMPVVATRLCSPRATFTVMVGRNVMLDGILSLGLARVFLDAPIVVNDRYSTAAAGSTHAVFGSPSIQGGASATKSARQVNTFFSTKGGFGIDANTWGVFDNRKEDSQEPAMIGYGGNGESSRFRKLCEGDLITWAVDFLCASPWVQVTINGDEFVHRFSGLRGHYQQYVFGIVLAMEHEMILIPDGSVLDALPAPVFAEVDQVESAQDTVGGIVPSLNFESPYQTAAELPDKNEHRVFWDYHLACNELKENIGVDSVGRKGDATRLLAAIQRILRSLLGITLAQNLAAASGSDNKQVTIVNELGRICCQAEQDMDPFGGLFVSWLVNARILHQILLIAFRGHSSTLRQVATKLVTFVVPLCTPEMICRVLNSIGVLSNPEDTSGTKFGTTLLTLLGETINPFRLVSDVQRLSSRQVPFLTQLTGIRQAYEMLKSICCSPLRLWWKSLYGSIQHALSIGLLAVDDLVQINKCALEDISNSSAMRKVQVLDESSINLLLGLLSAAGGWQPGLGLVPGAIVRHVGVGNTLSEQHVVIGFGSLGTFGESVVIAPLAGTQDAIEHKAEMSGSDFETVFSFYLQGEQRRSGAFPAILRALRGQENIQSFTEVILNCLASDKADLRQRLAAEAGDSDSKKPPQTQLRSITMESSHPYRDNTDETFEITIPGATELLITFDSQTRTEANYDYVRFYKDSSSTSFWGQEKYSGSNGWPGVNGVEPLRIGAGQCFLHFHSDGSNNDWGYKFTAEATVNVTTVQSMRPPFPELALLRQIHIMAVDASSHVVARFKPPAPPKSVILVNTSDGIPKVNPLLPFYRKIIHLLMHPIINHAVFYNLLNSKTTELSKEVDLSAIPKASSSYVSRIIQTLSSSNIRLVNSVNSPLGHRQRPNANNTDTSLIAELVLDMDDIPTDGLSVQTTTVPQTVSLSSSVINAINTNVPGTNNSCPDQADIATLQHSSSLDGGTARGAAGSISVENINSDGDIGSAKFRLRCSAGTTHCRIRARATLDSPEVGDVANATVIDVSGQVADFYRLADGRGFVKKDVVDAIVWDRQDPYKGGANKSVDFLEKLLLQEVGFLTAWSSYCLLCEVIANWPSDISLADCITPGLLQLLLRASGLGKLSFGATAKSSTSKTIQSKDIVVKSVPLLTSLKRYLSSVSTSTFVSPVPNYSLGPDDHVSIAVLLTNIACSWFVSVKNKAILEKGSRKEAEPIPQIPPVILESSHEYENNTDFVTKIHLPGAAGIEITFDEETSTERNYDYVAFYSERERRNMLAGKFSGRKSSGEKNWPGVGGRPSLILEGIDECWLSFITDGSNTDWGWKLTATALLSVGVQEKSQSDFNVQFSSGSVSGIQVQRKSLLTAGIACIDLSENHLKPTLGLALSLFQLLTETILTPELLFTAPPGIDLLVALANCADIIGEAHYLQTKCFMDIATKITLFYHSLRSPLGNSAPLEVRMPCSERVDEVVRILADNVQLLAKAAFENKKSPSTSASSRIVVPPPLLQSIAQSAVASALCIVPNSLATGSNYLLKDWEPSSRNFDENLDITQFGNGIKPRNVETAIARTQSLIYGPLFPDVVVGESGFEVPASSCSSGTEVSTTSDLDYSHTLYVRIVSMGQGIDLNSLCLSLLDSKGTILTDNPVLLEWCAVDATVGFVRCMEEKQDGSTFIAGDILSITLKVYTSDSCAVCFARNGVAVYRLHGSVNPTSKQLCFSHHVQSSSTITESSEPVVKTMAIGKSASLALTVKVCLGTEFVFLGPHEVPISMRSQAAMDKVCSLDIASSESVIAPTVVAERTTFAGTILKVWDLSFSDNELEFSENNTIARRPGSSSCYPASLIKLDTAICPPDPNGSYSLTAILTNAPRGPNSMSFGIAKAGFKKSGSDGFGPTTGSWGIIESRSSGDGNVFSNRVNVGKCRKMSAGDTFVVRYERRLGKAWLWLGANQSCHEFTIHNPGESVELVVGATYCNDHVLKILDCPPPPIPPALVESFNSLPLPNGQELGVASASSSIPRILSASSEEVIELTEWDPSLTQPALVLSNNNKSVHRPGSVSCYPAALINVPGDRKCSITAVLDQAPVCNNTMSFGISVKGFPTSGQQAFGERPDSWGLVNNRSEASSRDPTKILASGASLSTFRRLQPGDVFKIIVDVRTGRAELSINGSDFSQSFDIPVGKEYVVGATFCNDHKLTIQTMQPKLAAGSSHETISTQPLFHSSLYKGVSFPFGAYLQLSSQYLARIPQILESDDVQQFNPMHSRTIRSSGSETQSVVDAYLLEAREALDELLLIEKNDVEQIKELNFRQVAAVLPKELHNLSDVNVLLNMLLDQDRVLPGSLVCSELAPACMSSFSRFISLDSGAGNLSFVVREPSACAYVILFPNQFCVPTQCCLRITAKITTKALGESMEVLLLEEFGDDSLICCSDGGFNSPPSVTDCRQLLKEAPAEIASAGVCRDDINVQSGTIMGASHGLVVGDEVVRGAGWCAGNEDGGPGSIGQVVSITTVDGEVLGQEIRVRWRYDSSRQISYFIPENELNMPLTLCRRSRFTKYLASSGKLPGGTGTETNGRKFKLWTPALCSELSISLISVGESSTSNSSLATIDFCVLPIFTPTVLLRDEIFQTQRDQVHRRFACEFGVNGRTGNSLRIRADDAMVGVVEKHIRSKSISSDSSMPAQWSNVELGPAELLLYPVLTQLHSESEECAIGSSTVLSESAVKVSHTSSSASVLNNSVFASRYALVKLLNAELASCLDYIDLQQSSVPVKAHASILKYKRTLAGLLAMGRSLLFSWLKDGVVQKAINSSSSEASSKFELVISRSRSTKFSVRGEADVDGRWSVFGQVFRRVHGMPASVLRRTGQLWDTVFAGERAQDAGGPYREAWSSICQDLMSPHLPLLKPTPNKLSAVGQYQDCHILNPDCANNTTQIDMLVFLGKLMGCAARNKNYLDLCIAPVVWKALVREEIYWDDIRDVDLNGCNQLQWLRQRKDLTEERFSEGYSDLFFSTTSKGGSLVELHPGGATQPVTWGQDIDLYCDELQNYWMNQELLAVAAAVRLGLETQLPASALNFIRWNELEEMVCGNPKIDVNLLQSATEYERGCSATDAHIVWFWELMHSTFSEEDKRAFIRFVWGRTRLPLNRAAFTQQFKLQGFSVRSGGNADDYLPVSHTCFFSVEIPRYSSKEVLKKKLLYAIYNCAAIDGDDTGAGLRAAALGMEL